MSYCGFCYYPAGHLIHFLIPLFVHLNTKYATEVMYIVHFACHTVSNIFALKLAHLYAPSVDKGGNYDYNYSKTAQLIAFFFIAADGERRLQMGMFNDIIMNMYIVICFYCFAKDRLLLAGVFFSLALGLKAGAVLTIPAILGLCQYNHGTMTTIFALIFIVGV